ncbi:MAG: hypothetical protein MHM6MM_001435 [Cercozoa sp. M6MM]
MSSELTRQVTRLANDAAAAGSGTARVVHGGRDGGRFRVRRNVSLLYDPKVADRMDDMEILNQAWNGLTELGSVDPRFARYKNSLFGTGKDGELAKFDRLHAKAATVKSFNEKVDEFLSLLAPHWRTLSAHQCVEHLLRRFDVHRFNSEALLSSALPVHDEPVFGRLAKLTRLEDPKWNLLLKNLSGGGLARQTLANRCLDDPTMLRHVASLCVKGVRIDRRLQKKRGLSAPRYSRQSQCCLLMHLATLTLHMARQKGSQSLQTVFPVLQETALNAFKECRLVPRVPTCDDLLNAGMSVTADLCRFVSLSSESCGVLLQALWHAVPLQAPSDVVRDATLLTSMLVRQLGSLPAKTLALMLQRTQLPQALTKVSNTVLLSAMWSTCVSVLSSGADGADTVITEAIMRLSDQFAQFDAVLPAIVDTLFSANDEVTPVLRKWCTQLYRRHTDAFVSTFDALARRRCQDVSDAAAKRQALIERFASLVDSALMSVSPSDGACDAGALRLRLAHATAPIRVAAVREVTKQLRKKRADVVPELRAHGVHLALQELLLDEDKEVLRSVLKMPQLDALLGEDVLRRQLVRTLSLHWLQARQLAAQDPNLDGRTEAQKLHTADAVQRHSEMLLDTLQCAKRHGVLTDAVSQCILLCAAMTHERVPDHVAKIASQCLGLEQLGTKAVATSSLTIPVDLPETDEVSNELRTCVRHDLVSLRAVRLLHALFVSQADPSSAIDEALVLSDAVLAQGGNAVSDMGDLENFDVTPLMKESSPHVLQRRRCVALLVGVMRRLPASDSKNEIKWNERMDRLLANIGLFEGGVNKTRGTRERLLQLLRRRFCQAAPLKFVRCRLRSPTQAVPARAQALALQLLRLALEDFARRHTCSVDAQAALTDVMGCASHSVDEVRHEAVQTLGQMLRMLNDGPAATGADKKKKDAKKKCKAYTEAGLVLGHQPLPHKVASHVLQHLWQQRQQLRHAAHALPALLAQLISNKGKKEVREKLADWLVAEAFALAQSASLAASLVSLLRFAVPATLVQLKSLRLALIKCVHLAALLAQSSTQSAQSRARELCLQVSQVALRRVSAQACARLGSKARDELLDAVLDTSAQLELRDQVETVLGAVASHTSADWWCRHVTRQQDQVKQERVLRILGAVAGSVKGDGALVQAISDLALRTVETIRETPVSGGDAGGDAAVESVAKTLDADAMFDDEINDTDSDSDGDDQSNDQSEDQSETVSTVLLAERLLQHCLVALRAVADCVRCKSELVQQVLSLAVRHVLSLPSFVDLSGQSGHMRARTWQVAAALIAAVIDGDTDTDQSADQHTVVPQELRPALSAVMCKLAQDGLAGALRVCLPPVTRALAHVDDHVSTHVPSDHTVNHIDESAVLALTPLLHLSPALRAELRQSVLEAFASARGRSTPAALSAALLLEINDTATDGVEALIADPLIDQCTWPDRLRLVTLLVSALAPVKTERFVTVRDATVVHRVVRMLVKRWLRDDESPALGEEGEEALHQAVERVFQQMHQMPEEYQETALSLNALVSLGEFARLSLRLLTATVSADATVPRARAITVRTLEVLLARAPHVVNCGVVDDADTVSYWTRLVSHLVDGVTDDTTDDTTDGVTEGDKTTQRVRVLTLEILAALTPAKVVPEATVQTVLRSVSPLLTRSDARAAAALEVTHACVARLGVACVPQWPEMLPRVLTLAQQGRVTAVATLARAVTLMPAMVHSHVPRMLRVLCALPDDVEAVHKGLSHPLLGALPPVAVLSGNDVTLDSLGTHSDDSWYSAQDDLDRETSRLVPNDLPSAQRHLAYTLVSAMPPRLLLPHATRFFAQTENTLVQLVLLRAIVLPLCAQLSSQQAQQLHTQVFQFVLSAANSLSTVEVDETVPAEAVEEALVHCFVRTALNLHERQLQPLLVKWLQWTQLDALGGLVSAVTDVLGNDAAKKSKKKRRRSSKISGISLLSLKEQGVKLHRAVTLMRVVRTLARSLQELFLPVAPLVLEQMSLLLRLVVQVSDLEDDVAVVDASVLEQTAKRRRSEESDEEDEKQDEASAALLLREKLLQECAQDRQCLRQVTQLSLDALGTLLHFDSELRRFMTQERFDSLAMPLVGLLSAVPQKLPMSDMEYRAFAAARLVPCIGRLALACVPRVALGDDAADLAVAAAARRGEARTKPLNAMVLRVATNAPSVTVRACAVACLADIIARLRHNWLPLLPETTPALAELLEHRDQHVEQLAQHVVKQVELLSGEDLRKYLR